MTAAGVKGSLHRNNLAANPLTNHVMRSQLAYLDACIKGLLHRNNLAANPLTNHVM